MKLFTEVFTPDASWAAVAIVAAEGLEPKAATELFSALTDEVMALIQAPPLRACDLSGRAFTTLIAIHPILIAKPPEATRRHQHTVPAGPASGAWPSRTSPAQGQAAGHIPVSRLSWLPPSGATAQHTSPRMSDVHHDQHAGDAFLAVDTQR